MTRRVGLYARVSTNGQNTDSQLHRLRQIADARGWTVVAEFIDHGISGAKGRDKRPQLDSMMTAAANAEIDIAAAWSLNRLGRSLSHLVTMGDDLRRYGVDLFISEQNIDTTSPAGELMFNMLGAFAQFERRMINERITAGIEKARAQGKRFRRPPAINDVARQRVLNLLAAGGSVRKVAAEVGINPSMVARIKKKTST